MKINNLDAFRTHMKQCQKLINNIYENINSGNSIETYINELMMTCISLGDAWAENDPHFYPFLPKEAYEMLRKRDYAKKFNKTFDNVINDCEEIAERYYEMTDSEKTEFKNNCVKYATEGAIETEETKFDAENHSVCESNEFMYEIIEDELENE